MLLMNINNRAWVSLGGSIVLILGAAFLGGLFFIIPQFPKPIERSSHTLIAPDHLLTAPELEAADYAGMDVFVDHVYADEATTTFHIGNFPVQVYDPDITSKIFYKDRWYLSAEHDVVRFTTTGTIDGVTNPRLRSPYPVYTIANFGSYLFIALWEKGIYQVDLESNRVVAVYNLKSGLENVQNLRLGVSTSSLWVGTFQGQGIIDPVKRVVYFRLSETPSANGPAIPNEFVPVGYQTKNGRVLISDHLQPEFQFRSRYSRLFQIGKSYYLVHGGGIDIFGPDDRFPRTYYQGETTNLWWGGELEAQFISSEGRYLLWISNDVSEYDGAVLSVSIDVFDTVTRRHIVHTDKPTKAGDEYSLGLIDTVFRQEGDVVYVGTTSTSRGIYRVDLSKMVIGR